MLRTVLTIVQVFASLSIVALVLLQRGRGADAGAGFGAGASGSVFGARGATTGLSRSTAVFAAIFMVNSLALAWLGSRPDAISTRGLIEQPAVTLPSTGNPAPLRGGVTGQVVPEGSVPAAVTQPESSATTPSLAPSISAPAPMESPAP